jgi:hypothetical protein
MPDCMKCKEVRCRGICSGCKLKRYCKEKSKTAIIACNQYEPTKKICNKYREV